MYRLTRLLGAVVLLSTATASLASAGSLYFDDAAQVTAADGVLCCDGSVVEGSTDQACEDRSSSCVLTAGCTLQLNGSSAPAAMNANLWVNGPGCVAGIIVSQADGALTYFPNPGSSGSETFFYRPADANGNTGLGVFVVEVQ
jgi:hypothetical protein